MYTLELNDIIFLASCLKNPNHDFPLMDAIQLSSSNMRSSNYSKLKRVTSRKNIRRNSFICRLPRLWNALPPIDTSQSIANIKTNIKHFLRNHFINHFNRSDPCSYHFICLCSRCLKVPRITNFHPFNINYYQS